MGDDLLDRGVESIFYISAPAINSRYFDLLRGCPGVWTGVLVAYGAVLDVRAVHGRQGLRVARCHVLPSRSGKVG